MWKSKAFLWVNIAFWGYHSDQKFFIFDSCFKKKDFSDKMLHLVQDFFAWWWQKTKLSIFIWTKDRDLVTESSTPMTCCVLLSKCSSTVRTNLSFYDKMLHPNENKSHFCEHTTTFSHLTNFDKITGPNQTFLGRKVWFLAGRRWNNTPVEKNR